MDLSTKDISKERRIMIWVGSALVWAGVPMFGVPGYFYRTEGLMMFGVAFVVVGVVLMISDKIFK